MAAAPVSSIVSSQDATLQRNVFVKIVEEPASKALRFRYECEGRSADSLPGASSTQDKKSFPKIQVVGHRGRAVVVVSCVTVDPPYRPHPHNLVGKEGCKKGVCTMEIANEDMTCEFSNLGIQCVKKKDIEDSLKIREEIRVDPFRMNKNVSFSAGFQHKTQPGSIDLNSVRLCFQVFLEGPERGQFKVPLKPVVSEPIYDKKAINDLTIMKLSDCTSPVMGNKEIILLCDKVSKDDIEIRFYEENEENGSIVWESFGDFQPSDVHKQYAICFRTPQYHNLEITSPARVFVQLRCPSKDTTSAARPFQYIPLLTSDLKRKRQKYENANAISQYFNINKRPRQNSYPPVGSPPVQSPQNPGLPQQPGLQSPVQPAMQHVTMQPPGAQMLYSPSQSQPMQLLQQNVYVKQEPNVVSSPPPQYYYEMMAAQQQQALVQPQSNQPQIVQYSGGGIIETNEQALNSDFSLPNLSDVNLSLLDQHLSQNLNDMNINNF